MGEGVKGWEGGRAKVVQNDDSGCDGAVKRCNNGAYCLTPDGSKGNMR